MRLQPRARFGMLLLVIGILSGTVHAEATSTEKPADVVAAAKAMASRRQFRDAVDKLESFSGSIIGDPAMLEIDELLSKYYLNWSDESAKVKKYAETCACLFRMGAKPKIFTLEGEQGVREKLLMALLEWEKDLLKHPAVYTEVLAVSQRAIPLLGDGGAPLHRRLFVSYLKTLNDMELLTQVAKFRFQYDYPAAEIPDDLKKKIGSAATSILPRASGGTQPETVIELTTAALEVTGDPAIATQRDKLLLAMAQLYDKYRNIELARQYYNCIAKNSKDANMLEQAKKAISALDVKQAQFEKMAVLPDEITKDTQIKALPIPYVISGKLVVKPGVKVIVEKGTHIRGGRIELHNKATMDFMGTADTPIVLCDVSLNSDVSNGFRGVYTGINVVLIRVNVGQCDFSSGGSNTISTSSNNREMTFSQSQFIGPMVCDISSYMVYSLKNCTFTNCKLQGMLYRDRELVFNSLVLQNCELDAGALFCLSFANLINCRTYKSSSGDYSSYKDLSQKTVWMDSNCQAILEEWKTPVVCSVQSYSSSGNSNIKTKLTFIPASQSNQNCGASWMCPSFAAPVLDHKHGEK